MNWIVLILAGLCECGFAFCLGKAYPVWTGIGAVGTVLLGILVFKEPATFWRLFFTFTLIASIICLKVVQ